eukprot:TRINITY_DN5586_c0_g1_i8.p1 TRINITY_DN5586_c0_g1~~TRINITY_DN5586_c0_g1_i8.p1  ORF type:complete len:511 (-),score=83.92 TRINITY_DN5586_c0_g1_i8:245-1777(-)
MPRATRTLLESRAQQGAFDTVTKATSTEDVKIKTAELEVEQYRPLWFIDGEAYDLAEFLPNHPGGAIFLCWKDRDWSISVNTYHKDPTKTKAAVQKYKVANQEAAMKQMKAVHVPESALGFLPEGFDARTAIPTYDFDPENKQLFLNECRSRVLKPDVQKKIKELDLAFDRMTAAIGAFYLSFLAMWLSGSIPFYISVPVFAMCKTAFAGAGHYLTHRKVGDNFWNCLFDVNYVGTALTGMDGHDVGHHAFLLSEADPKAGFFGGMMAIPRLWRVPAHTLQKFFLTMVGIFFKGLEVHMASDSPYQQFKHLRDRKGKRATPAVVWSFWMVRSFMVAEFVLACWCGVYWSWLGQFFVTLWVNTLLVVASHDYEEQDIHSANTKDWGKFHLENTEDLTIIGNPYVDCFLSAGLSPHRAHHLFPYQRSGWANIYTTQYIKATAEKFGYEWKEPANFWTERCPSLIRSYLLGALADPLTRKPVYETFFQEHFAAMPYFTMVKYILAGVVGIGAI